MNKLRIFCALSFFFFFATAQALDLHFQPRFEVGAVLYDWEEESIGPADPQIDQSNKSSGRTIKDELPFVSGGATLFLGKAFLDFQTQYAFDGEDQDAFNTTTNASEAGNPFPVAPNSKVEAKISSQTKFDRIEFAVSVGYALTENFFVYTGYKRAETNFKQQLTGQLTSTDPNDNSARSGQFKSHLKTNLTYHGPFVGLGYSTNIDFGLIKGALSATFAVAFLEGRTRKKFSNSQISEGSNPEQTIDFNQFGRLIFGDNLDGSTTGFSAGITWRGYTPVEGLTYSVAASGYRYKFQSKTTPDFSEDIIRFNFAVNYLF